MPTKSPNQFTCKTRRDKTLICCLHCGIPFIKRSRDILDYALRVIRVCIVNLYKSQFPFVNIQYAYIPYEHAYCQSYCGECRLKTKRSQKNDGKNELDGCLKSKPRSFYPSRDQNILWYIPLNDRKNGVLPTIAHQRTNAGKHVCVFMFACVCMLVCIITWSHKR